jgi:uncharacterized radical SAM superfamily Fe-S cluster-containing enzyme
MERILHETTSLCRTCKRALSAEVVVPAGGVEVWMRKRCPEHGPQEVRLSDDADWYARTRAIPPRLVPPPRAPRPVEHGCPFDCGACASHQQKVRMPVVTITSACNLECPICYVHNKNEGAYHMSMEDFERILEHLTRDHAGEVDLINLTGGDPTLHPQLLALLERAQQAGIHRVSLCTNGLRLARDEALVARLGELGARVALSFDTFEPAADVALQGAHLLDLKLRCLELLERHDVDTTLIPVATRGINDHELGRIVELGLRLANVRHIEIHTMTYTGPGGVGFDRAGRISMHEVLTRLGEQTSGLLAPDDFVPSPCAHPLCYQIAYLLGDPAGGPPVSLARLVGPEPVYQALSERLYLEPTRGLEDALRSAIDRLYCEAAADGEAERTLALLKDLLLVMFPPGRALDRRAALRAGERRTKAIYVHSHMDEETFDVERVAQCCDSNCYPDGTTIPVCSYNVLYREKEERFMQSPLPWGDRSGGAKPVRLPVVGG